MNGQDGRGSLGLNMDGIAVASSGTMRSRHLGAGARRAQRVTKEGDSFYLGKFSGGGSVADATIEYYRRLQRFEKQFPEEQWITVRFDELVRDPMSVVERLYAHLGLPMSAEAARAIGEEAAASAGQRSRAHSYSLEGLGLTPEAIYEPLREVFEAYGFEP